MLLWLFVIVFLIQFVVLTSAHNWDCQKLWIEIVWTCKQTKVQRSWWLHNCHSTVLHWCHSSHWTWWLPWFQLLCSWLVLFSLFKRVHHVTLCWYEFSCSYFCVVDVVSTSLRKVMQRVQWDCGTTSLKKSARKHPTGVLEVRISFLLIDHLSLSNSSTETDKTNHTLNHTPPSLCWIVQNVSNVLQPVPSSQQIKILKENVLFILHNSSLYFITIPSRVLCTSPPNKNLTFLELSTFAFFLDCYMSLINYTDFFHS